MDITTESGMIRVTPHLQNIHVMFYSEKKSRWLLSHESPPTTDTLYIKVVMEFFDKNIEYYMDI